MPGWSPEVKSLSVVLVLAGLVLVGCGDRKVPAQAASAVGAEASVAEAGESADPSLALVPMPEVSPEAREAYRLMEDRYIRDPIAQWAESARSGYSVGGESTDAVTQPDPGAPTAAVGPVDGQSWINTHEDEGVDWLQLGYARPVQATAVRVVMYGRPTVKSITRVDLIDEAGEIRTAWTGESEVAEDLRGNRTWFVREFELTPFKVVGVKLFFGNKVAPGPKRVDAVQLVGQ